MTINLILTTVFSLIILLISAHFLIGNIVELSKKINVSQFFIATVTLAIGTSIPELGASIKSVTSGYSGVAVGNLIGSNIANVLLVVGLSAIIYPIKIFSEDIIKLEAVASIFIVIFPAMFLLKLNSNESIMISIVALLLFIYFVKERIRLEKINKKKIIIAKESIVFLILKNIFLLAGLALGAHFLINSSIKIAEIYVISERVIGLSLIAIGTSLPELIICAVAAIKKKQGIAIGTILGSNMYNVLAMLSFFEIIENVTGEKTGAISKNIVKEDVLVLALSTLLIFIFIMYPKRNKNISRFEGSLLFFFYLIYIFWIYTS